MSFTIERGNIQESTHNLEIGMIRRRYPDR
jgi:hypothetical protein